MLWMPFENFNTRKEMNPSSSNTDLSNAKNREELSSIALHQSLVVCSSRTFSINVQPEIKSVCQLADSIGALTESNYSPSSSNTELNNSKNRDENSVAVHQSHMVYSRDAGDLEPLLDRDLHSSVDDSHMVRRNEHVENMCLIYNIAESQVVQSSQYLCDSLRSIRGMPNISFGMSQFILFRAYS